MFVGHKHHSILTDPAANTDVAPRGDLSGVGHLLEIGGEAEFVGDFVGEGFERFPRPHLDRRLADWRHMGIPQGHRAQLDGLRAMAVLFVAFGHWFGTEHFANEPLWPYLGVELFFVLSGYLITGILLDTRRKVAASDTHWTRPVLAFFARRLLRLVPALYIYLIVTTTLGLFGDADGLAWYFAYLGNYRMAALGYGPDGAYHLWSLAVEEQFYLFVPFVVLLTRRMSVLRMFSILMGGSLLTLLFSQRMELTGILPPAAFTGLLGGCLLAALAHRGLAHPRLVTWIGAVGGVMYFLLRTLRVELGIGHWLVPTEIFLVLALSGIVWAAARGESRVGQFLFDRRAVRWLGSVSYGFYLWHVVARTLVNRQAPGLLDGRPMVLQFLVYFAVTLVPTTISYYTLERASTSFKRHFPYVTPPVATASVRDRDGGHPATDTSIAKSSF